MPVEYDEREREALVQAFELPPPGQVPVPQQQSSVTIEQQPVGAQKVAVLRDEARVLQKIKALAAAAGADWFYRFPVKKKGGGTDFITGPSIKLANNIARLYGNCTIDVRLVDNGATWWIYAKFIDLETGFSMVRPFQQDKGASRMGGTGPEAEARRLDIALQIGVSKAIRNVIVNSLELHCDFAFTEAQRNLVGRIGANLNEYRARAIKWFADNAVALGRVEATMGRAAKDWLAPDLARLAAEIKAVEDGMATADETWPPGAPPEPKRDPPPAEMGSGDTQAAPVAPQPAPPDESAPPAAAPEQPADAPDAAPARNWGIGGNLLGQDEVWRAINDLVGIAETDNDLLLIREHNAGRIARFAAARKVELNGIMTARAAELAKGTS
jgi:hypothetical protein